MFGVGDVIDGKYRVEGSCSHEGGMGEILHVTPLISGAPFPLVLKYCKDLSEEQIKRFRREVRLLGTFQGNSKVVQIWDEGLRSDPPYYVMKYYPEGDLCSIAQEIRSSHELAERVFLKMIDCIEELHSRNEYHRDIKPQNFLRDGDDLVVSDLGLSTELSSVTAFTRSSVFWGTHGYIPPEFMSGGFKHADAPGDIFMLGKTFYVLLSGRDPMYLMPDAISPALFHVVTRCCSNSKSLRYQTLADLRQSLVSSFDVLLGRAGGLLQELFSSMRDRLETTNQFDSKEVADFIEQLALSRDEEQAQVIFDLPRQFFSVIAQAILSEKLDSFLSIYEVFVESANYSWGHAEVVASRMNLIFRSTDVPPIQRAFSLDLAIRAANRMNRFAAMDACKAMVKSINDPALALQVAPIILKEHSWFLSDVEPSSCSSEAIRNAVRALRKSKQTANNSGF